MGRGEGVLTLLLAGHCRLVVYYQVDEKVTPFGKKIYQCHMKVKKQLDGDRVSVSLHHCLYCVCMFLILLCSANLSSSLRSYHITVNYLCCLMVRYRWVWLWVWCVIAVVCRHSSAVGHGQTGGVSMYEHISV